MRYSVMTVQRISTQVLAAVLFLSQGVSGELTNSEKVGLIAGCAVGGTILLVAIIFIVVCCCRSAKRAKETKKKAQYIQFHDPLSPNLYNTSTKPQLVEKPHVNGYLNNNLPRSARIERSRSDAYDNRGSHVKPGWRHQQDQRDHGGHHVNLKQSNSADGTLPAGIWTSNPSMTKGLNPQYILVGANGHIGHNGSITQARLIPVHMYGSEPALHSHRPSRKQKSRDGNRGSKNLAPVHEERSFSVNVDESKREHLNKPVRSQHSTRKDTSRIKEDTKELLPGSSSDETGSEREPKVVARAYSNLGYQKDSPPAVITNNSDKEPFVAKVYSDYQLPRDFIPTSQPHLYSSRQPVSKATSGYASDSVSSRHGTPDSHTSRTTISTSPDGHVVRAVVRYSGSFGSNGEPKYAQPQDAYKATQSDWILYSKKGKPVERTQSNMEKTRIPGVHSGAKRPLWSSGQQAARHSSNVQTKHSSQVVQRSYTEVRGPYHSPYTKGVVLRNTSGTHDRTHRRPLSQDSAVNRMTHDKEIKRSSAPPVDKHHQNKKSKKENKHKKQSRLGIDIKAAKTSAEERKKGQPLPAAPIYTEPQREPVNDALHIQHNNEDNLSLDGQLISESSSVRSIPALEPTGVESPIEHFVAPEDPNAIYAAPLKKENRPSSEALKSEIVPTPLSPDPPPVPPKTDLRDDGPTPVQGRRILKSTTSDGDGISTEKSFSGNKLEKISLSSIDDINSDIIIAGRSIAKAFEFLDTYHETSNDDTEETESLVTNVEGQEGKCVIGDAFRFLEDFDDSNSIDGEVDRL